VAPSGAGPTRLNRQSPGRDVLPSGTCDEARETSVAPEDAIQPTPEQQVESAEPSQTALPDVLEPTPADVEAASEPAAPEVAQATEPAAEPAAPESAEPEAAEAPEPAVAPATPAPAAPESAAPEAPQAPDAEVQPPAAPVPPLVLTPEEYADRVARIGQLLDGADQVLAATDLPDARTRWNALRRDWTALAAGMTLDEATAARVAGVERRIDARDAAIREARARQQQGNLNRLQALCDEMEKLVRGEHLTLRDAERALREIRAALDAPGPLPTRQDQQAIVGRLKSIQSLVFPRVQDLREADGWERWANAGVQESLIARLESLREQTDLAVVAKQLRVVQDEWHKVRSVPREKGRELWQRYKIIEGELRLRCESFFAQLAAERVDNLRKKEELCAQVESLADSTDWIRTAETIKAIQAQWKDIGPVTPGHEKAVWERFRAACDHFFTRRKADLSERKAVWLTNLKKKEAICAEAEALSESTDWDHALSEIKRIQAEWRLVGPVKRNRSEALLARFHAACEKFFDRYAHRNDHELAAQAAARELLVAELEALTKPADAGEASPADPPDAVAKKVMALKRQWDQSPVLPRAQAEPLVQRYDKALADAIQANAEAFKGTDLDPDATRKKMEHLCEVVEGCAGEEKGSDQRSPAEILAAQLREALAANTIGGRADDEARWRNAAEDVRRAQASWRRLTPLHGEQGRELEARFQRACTRFFRLLDQRRRPASSGPRR